MTRKTLERRGFSITSFTVCAAILILLGHACGSGSSSKQTLPALDQHSASVDSNALFPFGRLNANAPAETAQFDFLIGSFDCDERMRAPGGPWRTSRGTWTARYVLDGWLIEDVYRGVQHSFLGVRYIDRETRDWSITFYGAPGDPDPTTWTGQLRDGRMRVHTEIVLPDQRPATVELSFDDVTPEGFTWQNATIVQDSALVTWTLVCSRTMR